MKHCPSRIWFFISFPQIPSDVLGCWEILADYLYQYKAMPNWFRMSQIAGHSENQQSEQKLNLDPLDVPKVIESRHLTAFCVNTGYTERSVSYELQHGSFSCRIEDKAEAPDEWRQFIEAVASRFEIIGGWQPFWPYRTWQDLRQPSDFQWGGWGPFPPGYKMWHVPDKYGIGPGQTLFDPSKNPGRTKTADDRSIFFPTAEMWLGPHFWQYAKCTKEDVLAADFFLEKRDTPRFLYLKCWPEPFTRPDGEQGRMQQRLWKLFFHEDCEWPPGSGTISDMPVYGPPELMPGYVPPGQSYP